MHILQDSVKLLQINYIPFSLHDSHQNLSFGWNIYLTKQEPGIYTQATKGQREKEFVPLHLNSSDKIFLQNEKGVWILISQIKVNIYSNDFIKCFNIQDFVSF